MYITLQFFAMFHAHPNYVTVKKNIAMYVGPVRIESYMYAMNILNIRNQ